MFCLANARRRRALFAESFRKLFNFIDFILSSDDDRGSGSDCSGSGHSVVTVNTMNRTPKKGDPLPGRSVSRARFSSTDRHLDYGLIPLARARAGPGSRNQSHISGIREIIARDRPPFSHRVPRHGDVVFSAERYFIDPVYIIYIYILIDRRPDETMTYKKKKRSVPGQQ